MTKLAVVGGGSWGAALAIVLAPRFEQVRFWIREPDLAERTARTRENDVFLPGFRLPGNIQPGSDLGQALDGADVVLTVVPSQYLRATAEAMRPHIRPGMEFVSASKGIETGRLLRMSEVLVEVLEIPRVAVLSGPTFAKEVAGGEPAAIVVASADDALARAIQTRFSGPSFRLYRNPDVIGVEVGAALKNVIAIAAGVCQGLGLGSNAKAALITRGLAEITRLAVAMGGDARTLAGLAGLGDLVLTCSGDLSRNRQVGLQLAAGKSIGEIVSGMRMVAEGVETTHAAMALARKHNVDLPITSQMESILAGAQSPAAALRQLLERSLKDE